MSARVAAFKEVMNELRSKIKEHSTNRHQGKGYETEEEEAAEGEPHSEPDGDEDDEDEEEEKPEGPDLCNSCGEKTEVEHKYCANCGAKK